MTFANKEQAEFWAGLAPTWVEIEPQLDEVVGDAGRIAMDRLGVQRGQNVLDLGCGTGQTTLELARRAAPTGRAVGVDIAAEMLVRARKHATDNGVENVEFLHADVQSDELGVGRFDAAYSRFGVMFYSDPVAAFTAVNRAIRPGAALSFVCWQPLTANDWMLVPGMAAFSALGQAPPPPAPEEPGPFSLADPDRVRRILSSAGFGDIEIEPHNDFLVTPEDRISEISAIAARVGAARELLKDAAQATRDRVKVAIEEALRSRAEHGEVRASKSFFAVTAKV